MSQIIKPVMLDETGQVTNTRLTELGTKVDGLGTTMTNNTAATGQKLDAVKDQLHTLAEAIAAVKTVNGMDGDVVIDATNISVNKLNNPKTIKQVLDEEQASVNSAVTSMQQAIARTPVSFAASKVEGEDYLLTITLGSP